MLDVRGNLCAGVASCGSNGNAASGNPITLTWAEPAVPNATGECYGLGSGNSQIMIEDPLLRRRGNSSRYDGPFTIGIQEYAF